MLFQTTAAHEELRAKIRSFAEEEIKPLAFLMDQNNEFPEEAVKKLGKLGWMGIPYPKEYGGAGLDALSYAIAVEELARVDGGAGVILSAHVSLGSWPIFAYGTEEQKKKYLVPLAKGEKIGAFGLTEPNAGSDAGGTETTALDKGDYYLLNGGKIFITNAPNVAADDLPVEIDAETCTGETGCGSTGSFFQYDLANASRRCRFFSAASGLILSDQFAGTIIIEE